MSNRIIVLAFSTLFCLGLAKLAADPKIDPALIPKAPPAPDAPTWQKPFKFEDYKGKPFQDDVYKGGPQQIPGTVLCAYYDVGGEGITYHDTTPKNLGSGMLNTAKDYLSQFRKDDAVDLSYTKKAFDESEFDKVKPIEHLLYVGWTEPGEWLNYTVNVKEAGTYAVDFLYTSRIGGTLGFDINGTPVSGLVPITSNANDKGPQDYHQWHYWNYAKEIADVKLPKGINVLTVRVMDNGQMNLGYLVFYPKPAEPKGKEGSGATTASTAAPSPARHD